MEFVKCQSKTLQNKMKGAALLHSFDSVANGAHAERHLRTVRLPAWTLKWQISGNKHLLHYVFLLLKKIVSH